MDGPEEKRHLQIRYFDRDGVPYAQTTSADGEHSVYNCAFDAWRRVDEFQRLEDWKEISAETFGRLRAAHLQAQENTGFDDPR